jgi:hypothetical protein
MPNIIQQQDLLKGLPDARLAMLLQNPVGDIPPFLVAAEAQRRQAIRQQFAGTEQKESVVDTLTKQMAKVPQNIQSGQMTTPPVPPTPQMQGVMALQQQQAMQQAAQQVMPQQVMRAGGPVQRYQDQGLVQRYNRYGPRGAGAPPPVPRDDVSILESMKNFLFPDVAGSEPSGAILQAPTVEGIAEQRKKVAAPPRIFPEIAPGSAGGMAFNKPPPIPRDPENSTAGTSTENKDIAAAGAEENFRERIEALYGQTGLSDWEKAQKWFAASQQFLQPDQTLMQSLVGAAGAFAGGAAGESAAERESELAREKALLEWDISKYEAQRKEEADIARGKANYAREMEKLRFLGPDTAIKGYQEQIKGLSEEFNNIETSEERKNEIAGEIEALRASIATIMSASGYGYKGPTLEEMRKALAGN